MNHLERDELLSSYIDGLATPEETRLIENDPGLTARAAELRGAARLVATPVRRPDTSTVDATIAAALAESDTAGNVVSMSAARPPRSRHFVAISAAAAIIAIGFLAGAVILNLDSGDSEPDDLAAGVEDAEESTTAAAVPDPASESQLGEAEETGEAADESDGASEAADAAPEEDTDQAALEESPAEAASEESFDDSAGDEAIEEQASPTPESFQSTDELLAAIAADEISFHTGPDPLPCAVAPPEPQLGKIPAVVLAELPEGLIIVTGWTTEIGFEIDQILAVDLCPPSPLPTP
jgi:hypothetical protein